MKRSEVKCRLVWFLLPALGESSYASASSEGGIAGQAGTLHPFCDQLSARGSADSTIQRQTLKWF